MKASLSFGILSFIEHHQYVSLNDTLLSQNQVKELIWKTVFVETEKVTVI
jgi:hypothetical protein